MLPSWLQVSRGYNGKFNCLSCFNISGSAKWEKELVNLNLNCLNYNEDSNIRHFYHKVFELGFIPLIDKPTRICKNSATIIDNILTNCVFDNTLKKAIISDYFPIIFTIQTGKNQSKCQDLVSNKREFNETNKAPFKQQVSLLHWRYASSQKDENKMYETFLSTFLEIYETNFP